MIATTISVLLAASVAGTSLRVDGNPVKGSAVYQGHHSLSMGQGRPQTIDGEIDLHRNSGGRYRVMVRVDLEDYVAAAMESEAHDFQEPEALKAMAVVVRAYALGNLHRHGYADLCDGTHCQRLQFPANDRMKAAALATRGELVWFAGKPAKVFYHSHCGGATASAASVWGGKTTPYLVSKRDPYCERYSSAWNVRVEKTRLQRVFSAPAVAARNDDPVRVQVVSYGISGRVSRVSAGGKTWSGAQFRDLLSGMNGGAANIRSTRFRVVESADAYTFQGKGAGHGVGLCQHGTLARAEAGQNYRQILSAYFPGTRVSNKPDSQ